MRSLRNDCESHDLHLGLHTLSAVNIAEVSPYLSDAADEYLKANIDFAKRLGCDSVEVHAGYHFSSILDMRMSASLERLKRATDYAERVGMTLFLENLNFEPNDAEVHYLAHTIEECHYYFDAIDSASFRWAFTVNHANLVPEGIDGFLDEFGVDRIGVVRLADNIGEVEVHMNPGEGNIDFPSLFNRLESSGYEQHYMMAFGNPEDKLKARDYFGGLA